MRPMKYKQPLIREPQFIIERKRKVKDGFGLSWPEAAIIREKLLVGDFKMVKKKGKGLYEVKF